MQDLLLSRGVLKQHLRIVVLGILTGLLAVLFRLALEGLIPLRPNLMRLVGEGVAALGASLVLSLLFILVAVWITRRFCPEAVGSGIPQVKALALHPAPIRWLRLLLVKFTGGALALGGGLMLGREGPTVQMGAALGELLSRVGKVSPGERRQLLLLGAGAGLAGAFNAPLAGTIFILEELGEEFRPRTIFSMLLATFSADLMCRLFTGPQPQLGNYGTAAPELDLLAFFLLLGWLGGVLGVVFNQALLATLRITTWLHNRMGSLLFPAGLALMIGVVGWLNPSWVGGWHSTFPQGHQGLALEVALFLLGLRFLLTILSYACGTPGGLFAPVLVLGGLLGECLRQSWGQTHAMAFILVGIAALFTGVTRAPLAAILLVVEMAGAYALIPHLLGSVLVAWWTANTLGDRPIYEALMDRLPAKPGTDNAS